MRKTLGVCLLVLLLTGSANAGLIPNWPPAPPTAQESTGGEMPNDVTDSLTQTALELLALLL